MFYEIVKFIEIPKIVAIVVDWPLLLMDYKMVG